jgi:hypothetical protein
MAAAPMSSSAVAEGVRLWCAGSLTRKMHTLLGICESMLKHAGVLTFWLQLTVQRTWKRFGCALSRMFSKTEVLHLHSRRKRLVHSHTANTQERKSGMCHLPFRCEKMLKLALKRAEMVRWVCEDLRPFQIVKDQGFQRLMKTGRPEIYVPSPETISRDVKIIYAHTRERLAKMLQTHEGKLSFSTDAWTSPNHRAYVAFMVHLEHKGSPLMLPLDIVELAQVSQHTSSFITTHSPVLVTHRCRTCDSICDCS